MSDVELIDICKTFGVKRVIDAISLRAYARDFVVILGPSGCGKSTLLRLIAGLDRVDSGMIQIDGRRVDQLGAAERGAAMVFQQYALYPHMTVRDNLSFGLQNLRMQSREVAARVAEAAAMLEIEEVLDRYPGQISGGERQRVALGRAMVKRPGLFLLDEPLSNLDASLRVRTRLQIAQLHRQVESTMIFVTHDQHEAMTLATRVAVMNNGRIEQIGTPMGIYMRPATRFVASFVGSPAMNFLAAEIGMAADGSIVARLPGDVAIPTGIDAGELPGLRALTFGIRAEDISLCETDHAHLTARIKFVEHLGNRTLIYLDVRGEGTIAVEEKGSIGVVAGETVGLRFDPRGAHLFDDKRGYHSCPPQGFGPQS